MDGRWRCKVGDNKPRNLIESQSVMAPRATCGIFLHLFLLH